MTGDFDPPPNAIRLARAGRCSRCGQRGADVVIAKMLPPWMDAFRAGGSRGGRVNFPESPARDQDIAAGIAEGRSPSPELIVHTVTAEHAMRLDIRRV